MHCGGPVLATHRRSKVKGGGHVHEWCGPVLGAVGLGSTMQQNLHAHVPQAGRVKLGT